MGRDSILLAVDHDDEASPTVRFAAQELRRLLFRLTGRPVMLLDAAAAPVGALTLKVEPNPSGDPLDDAIAIDTAGATGTISGAGPRALLIAVYRYLTELGCRWVRPGPDGEYVPSVDLDHTSIKITERPGFRHRGVCIEGANSLTNLLDLIDWLPKVGLNSYFIQFEDPHVFLRSWYERNGDPAGRPNAYPRTERTAAAHRALLDGIELRGLSHHAVGHGWTSGVIGVAADGWNAVTGAEFRRELVAQVGGVRELWQGIPLNTELCYARPEARTAMARLITDHAAAHPEIDVLHVWLSDGTANHCECDDCSRLRPADWYVAVLNEVAELLAAAGSPTKIAFLAYHQLLWPPLSATIADPDRFVFMFAPIRRDHRRSLADARPGPLPDYAGNATEPPHSRADHLVLLQAWQRVFAGSSFDFDYHLMWQHWFDPGQLITARVLADDLRFFPEFGLDGLISCQSQRVFLPHGFAMTIMARTLWNPGTGFDAELDDHLAATYGPDAALVRQHLEQLSADFLDWNLDHRLLHRPSLDPAGIARTAERLTAFGAVIDDHRDLDHPVWAASWRALAFHRQLCLGLCRVFEAASIQDWAATRRHWADLKTTAWHGQDAYQAVFDAGLFSQTIERYLDRLEPAAG
ncbi:DUF4838 domain-containing protein [Microlunatus sp. GCM10028923]|uniref:DUF4838 domain-containing protein n=1 Tax=Microlunatus sp. GCM10028923 TaxID=3273400 RepID=UPI0036165B96